MPSPRLKDSTDLIQVKFHSIFDKDMEVEEHNLNRQVIYNEEDIGLTKISATQALQKS